MGLSSRRKRSLVGLLASVAGAIFFLLPVSGASAATQANACVNNIIATESSSIPITMTASLPATVEEGFPFTLKEIDQELAVPPTVFLSGYSLELLEAGLNEIPTKVQTIIAATNATNGETEKNKVGEEVPGATNVDETVAVTTITDPTPGNRSSGDETATPGEVVATYNNQTWTAAGVAGEQIEFREATVIEPLAADPPGFTAKVAGVTIEALVSGGAIKAQFGCDPGSVVEKANPSTIVRTETAVTFASTEIVAPVAHYALELTTSGTGSGSFQCDTGSGPEACESEYAEGTEVEVIPKPDPISEFVEFSGDCSGTSCTLTMDAAKSVNALFEEKEAVASVEGEVFGEVPQTTSIESACSSVFLGEFLPGVEEDYFNSCFVTLTSTGEASSLTASDQSGIDTGFLTQKPGHNYSLASPLLVGALDLGAQGGSGPPGGALTSPVTLLEWANPISKDLVGVGFEQHIGEFEGLHTGVYAKTITLTLEQTVP